MNDTLSNLTSVAESRTTPLLLAHGLTKTFGNGTAAVSNVHLSVNAGETVGIVGESGSGKSTTAKMLLRLIPADAGTISFAGRDLREARGRRLRMLRKEFQLVPQNPQTSFNPKLTISESIEFNMVVNGTSRRAARDRALDLSDRVGLPAVHLKKRPGQLSGGQLQRAAIARALSTNPRLIICDEAVSALDKSIQAQVLNLLTGLQAETGVAMLFISHDLAVVEHIADRVVVMRRGEVVEEGEAREIWSHPRDPYTQALLNATPERLLRSRTVAAD